MHATRRGLGFFLIAMLAAGPVIAQAEKPGEKKEKKAKGEKRKKGKKKGNAKGVRSIHRLKVANIDGEEISLRKFRNQVLMVVNVASL